MKRTIAAGLSAALLCGMVVPAFAADTKTATNTTGTTQTQPTAPVKLTFDKLEETVRQNNVTIKANNNTVLSAEKTDVSDRYIESYFQLSEQISSYQKQIKELQKTLKELGTDEANAGLRKTLESQISILQRNLAAAEASYKNLDDDEDDAEEDQEKTVDHTRRQMQNAADEICLSAENTYISLRGMKYTLNQTNRSIQQLDRNIATVQKQVKLGMTGVNTLKSLQAQRESAVAGKASLTTQVEALTNTLAIQCGYTTGTQIETSDLPPSRSPPLIITRILPRRSRTATRSTPRSTQCRPRPTITRTTRPTRCMLIRQPRSTATHRRRARPLPSASCIPTCRRSRPHLLRRMPILRRRKRRLR